MSLLSQGLLSWRYVERGFGSGQPQGISEQCDATKRLTLFGIVGKWGPDFSPGKLWQGMLTNRMVRVYIPFIYKELRRWGYYSPNSVAHMINYPPCNNFRCTTSRCFIHLHGSIAILPCWLLKHRIPEVWDRLCNPITKG